jgi:hypothetical protein
VDETVPVHPSERYRQTDRETQELSQFHRPSNQSIQRLATGILELEPPTPLVR